MATFGGVSVEEMRQVFQVLDRMLKDVEVTADMFRHFVETQRHLSVLIVRNGGV
jgi:hypothetical protein